MRLSTQFSFIALMLLFVIRSSGQGTVTDYDGNVYNVVQIGTQKWTQSNLQTAHYNDGSAITEIEDSATWVNIYNTNATTPAWCYYSGNAAYNATYGKLYNWYAVTDSRGVCPAGYHVPSDTEWTVLSNYLGGDAVSGGHLRSTSGLWLAPNTGADNSSEFTALPAGYRNFEGGGFGYLGDYVGFWSSTPYGTGDAWGLNLFDDSSSCSHYNYSGANGFSVRCVGAPTPKPSLKILNQNKSTGQKILLQGAITDINKDSVKICADGSSATQFIYFNADTSTIATSNIQFSVTDSNHTVDPVQLGYVSIDNRSNDTIYATLHHPSYVADNYKPRRLGYLSIDTNAGEICRIYLPIYRAPIVFVHGFLANNKTFQTMVDSLVLDNLYPRTFPGSWQYSPLVYRVDYSNTNAAHFATNSGVIPKGIDAVISQAVNRGYSCGKAIVAGHSMGGVLTRLYLQSGIPSQYVYRNDIQKIITINTPHYGTQLAQFGLKLGSNGTVENNALKLLIFGISAGLYNPIFPSATTEPSALSNFLQTYPAIQDLSYQSNATRYQLNIPQANQYNRVPSVTLSTNWVGTTNSFGILVHGLISNSIYCGEDNDLIVPVPSQKAGIALVNEVYGQWHVGSTDNKSIITEVETLINASPTDSAYFTTGGFPQGTLCTPAHLLAPEQNLISRSVSDSVKILSPVSHQTFNPGDTVSVNIYSEGNISKMLLVATGSNITPISIDTTNVALLRFVVPATALGEIDLTLLAGDTTGWYATDTTSILINSTVAPDSIVCSPRQDSIALGLTASINVVGYFSGNAVNLNGLAALNVGVDTSYLISQGNNTFQTKKLGSTTLLFAYMGKVDSTVMTIYNDPIALSTTFDVSSNQICAGTYVAFTPFSQGLVTGQYWYFPGGFPDTSSFANPTIWYDSAGTYGVTLITTFVNGTDTARIDSMVFVTNGPPIATVTQSGNLLVAPIGYTYQWYYAIDSVSWNPINGAIQDSFNAQNAGAYYVEITDANGCTNSSLQVYYPTTGIKQIRNESLISVYPNPATDQLFIETNGITIAEIHVYDALGKLVIMQRQPLSNRLNISNLASGMYVAEIITNQGAVNKRWVKM